MSVIFRIRPAGLIDGSTVPVITRAVQDPDSGIYDVEFNSLNDNFGVLDIQELFRIALGNTSDDFLVPQLILTDGAATTVLELSKLSYEPGGTEAGINRALLWSYLATAGDEIGPKPFLNYTGQRLILESDNGVAGEGEIYLIAYPVSGSEFLDAICCTIESGAAAPAGSSCCAPQYLSQGEFQDAFSFLPNTGNIDIDFDASVCGQDGPLTAVVRVSSFGAPGTPPSVVSVTHDGVANTMTVTLDSNGATDGNYVVEVSNACGCCYLFPVLAQSV